MDNYKVYGMTCVVCSNTVEKAVLGVKGVESCNVNLLLNSMQVEGDADPDDICLAVKEAGYRASYMLPLKETEDASAVKTSDAKEDLTEEAGEDPSDNPLQSMVRNLIISAVILLVLIFFSLGKRVFSYSLPAVFESNSVLLYVIEVLLTLSVMIINRNLFVSGFNSIIHKAPNTDSLVSLGVLASFLYSAVVSVINIIYYGNMSEYTGKTDLYFESSALIITFVALGKVIEEKAKGKTTDAIKGLSNLTPSTALILTDNGEKEIPIDEVRVGDIFILKPGMRIPVDGIVETGNSAVDESSLTGESIPVDKEPGNSVSAATINMSGYMTCRATEVGENTAFSHIVQMVTDASSQKTQTDKLSDRISVILIPVIIALALVTFTVWMFSGMGFGFALSRAVAVLIISCPCALSLATTVAVMVGSSIGAKHGILYKTSQALENAGLTQIVVVDKTGTITTGEPRVTDIISTVNDIEHRDMLLSVAYAIESKSEHPLAKAICRYAKSRYVDPLPTENFIAVSGKGISADILIGNVYRRVYAGNEAYIAQTILGMYDDGSSDTESSFDSDFSQVIHRLVDEGKTPLIFATENGLVGVIAVADEVNENSKEAVNLMHGENIHVVMVTGDRYATAKAVGDEIGIAKDEVLSEVLPQDKSDIVTRLSQTGKVAMIGDGINDAPALTAADIGIAIGAGTDVAIDAADVVLVKNNLLSAVDAIRLSRVTNRIIRENLFWTFFYNILGIPLAAGCFYRSFGLLLNPVFCAGAMSISSVIVVLNALRIFKFKGIVMPQDQQEEESANEAGIREANSEETLEKGAADGKI